MKEYYLRITSLCNADCIFCETRKANININIKEIYKIIIKLKVSGYNHIIITGGEPTIYLKELKQIVLLIKKLGGMSYSLQTNAISSSNLETAKIIYDLGFDSIMISFHSHIEEDFETIYGKKGTYQKVLNGIKNISQLHKNICINILCNSINFNYIEDILCFIQKYYAGIRYVGISPINAITENDKNSLLLRKTQLYNKIEDIGKNSIYNFHLVKNYFGIPYCIRNEKDREKNDKEEIDYNNHGLYSNYVFVNECNLCTKKNECVGINQDYLDIFGEREFKKI